MRREPERCVLHSPGTKAEKSLMARRPIQFLPFSHMNNPRSKHHWMTGSINKSSLPRVDPLVHPREHRAKNLCIGAFLYARVQHIGLHPASLISAFEWYNRGTPTRS